MLIRLITAVEVFQERMSLILAAIPHLWAHYRDWDLDHLDTLVFRLRRTEQCLRKDEHHTNAAGRADEVLEFLDLIDAYQNCFERISRPEGMESGFVREQDPQTGRTRTVYHSNEIAKEYYRQIEELKEKSWAQAWEFYAKHSRGWWT